LKIKKRLIKKYFAPIATFFIFLVIWELVITGFNIPSFVLPAPSAIINELINPLPGFSWAFHTYITLYESLLGFAIGILLGVGLAIALTSSDLVSNIIYPYIIALQVVPKVAFAPILLVWFGFGAEPKIMIAFLIAFFPMVINTAAGLLSVPIETIDVAKSFKASGFQIFRKIRLPASLPFFFAGLKLGVTLAVIGAVVAEFVMSDSGLGYIVLHAGYYADQPEAFAALTLLSAIGIGLFLIVAIAEKFALPWYTATRVETSTT
jgi:NitT/TauT family transport system permease protein